MSACWVVSHDCEVDTHDCRIIGPFDDRRSAWEFVERHGLEHPRDGGYAFAVVLPPEDEEIGDPVQWDLELEEANAE